MTHQLQFIPKADVILILKDGAPIAFGNYDQLVETGLDLVSLLGNESDEHEDAPNRKDSTQKEDEIINNRVNRTLSHTSSISETRDPDDAEYQPKVVEEAKSSGTLKTAVYLTYMRAGAGTFMLMLVAFLSLSSQVLLQSCDLFLSAWSNAERDFVDKRIAWDKLNVTNGTTGSPLAMPIPVDEMHQVIIYASLIAALVVFTLLRSTVFFRMCMRASVNFHSDVFIRVLRAPMQFFDTTPAGIILNRFARDLNVIDDFLPSLSYDLSMVITSSLKLLVKFTMRNSQVLCNSLGVLVVIAIVNAWLLIPAAFLTLIALKVRQVYMRTAREVRRIEGMSTTPIACH